MTNGDFIRSMTDEDIRENLTPGICELIKHRDPERCQNREHCFHCVKDWLKEENKIMVRARVRERPVRTRCRLRVGRTWMQGMGEER